MLKFHLINWLTQHPGFGGLIAFIVSFTESIAVIGSIIPGSVTMTAIGVLVGSGLIPISSTLFFGILGAILGDGLSYLIGYYFKSNIANYWPFKRYPKILISGEYFIKQHGGKSIFIGRFIGPIRATVPLIAGIMNMPVKKYFLASIPAGILWAPAYMLPGFLLGAASLELPTSFSVGLIIFVLIALVLLWIKAKLLFYVYDKSKIQFDTYLNAKWQKWRTRPKTKWFCHLLQNGGHIEQTGQIFLCFLAILFFVLFTTLFLAVKFHVPFLIKYNNIIYHLANSIRFANLDAIMVVIATFGYKYVLLFTTLVLILFFTAQKKYFIALHFFILSVAGSSAVFLCKQIMYSPRPNSFALSAHKLSSSFPSGHETLAVIFYGFLIFLLAKQVKPRAKTILYYLAFFIILSIGFSRIYLNAHWLSDVIGGILLGLAILIMLMISYNRAAPIGIKFGKTVFAALLSLLFCVCFDASISSRAQLQLSKIHLLIKYTNENIWWHQNNKNFALPIRSNRLGQPREPLNVQWLGNLANIKSSLQKSNWQNTATQNYFAIIKNIATENKVKHQSIFDKLYLDQHPMLDMVKTDKNENYKLHLLLWKSGIKIVPQNQTLWVGLLTREYHQKYLGFFHHQINTTATEDNISLLKKNIVFSWQTKIIIRKVPDILKNKFATTQLILIRDLDNAKN